MPALLLANLLGYVVFVGAGRLLGPADFAVFAAFWGLLFAFGGMTASVEQESARLVAAGTPARDPRLLGAGLVVGAVLSTGLVVAYPVTVDRILAGSWALPGLVVVAGFGFCVQAVVRGSSLGIGDLRTYGGLIVGEAALRAAALGIVLATAVVSPTTCAVAVTAGSFAWLAVLRQRRPQADLDGGRPDLGPLLRRLSNLVVAAGFTAAVVTGFPALAAAFAPPGQARELGVLLAALTITRLPLLLLGPVQALLVPEVVRRQAAGGSAAVRRLLGQVLTLAAGGSAVLAVAMLFVGPAGVRLVYGAEFTIAAGPLAAMTAGAGLVAVLLLLAAVLLALDRHSGVLRCWAACFTVVVLTLSAPIEPFTTRAVLALVLGPLVGVAVASFTLARVAGSVGRRAPAALHEQRTPPR
ncbi:MAG: hypothetical protein H7323_02595 [Frankiales bacterium]|nr:hypothetical protein [Frankiales bacterium]